jgi:hypothetical protein
MRLNDKRDKGSQFQTVALIIVFATHYGVLSGWASPRALGTQRDRVAGVHKAAERQVGLVLSLHEVIF